MTGGDPLQPGRLAYYLVTEDDLDQIDALLSALNSAIYEILTRRRVRENPGAPTPAQAKFNDQFHDAIDPRSR